MALQPTQSTLVQQLRGQARTVADSRLYLTQTLSTRIAESQFAAVSAQNAADTATVAAAAANSAAATAMTAAAGAQAAAETAYAVANSAAGAASTAQSAAAAAQNAANVLGLTHLWYLGTSADTITVPGGPSWSAVPDLWVAGELGTYPHIAFASAEFQSTGGTASISLGIAQNGSLMTTSDRDTTFVNKTTMQLAFPFTPAAGGVGISVVWKGVNCQAVGNRRQLALLRIGQL